MEEQLQAKRKEIIAKLKANSKDAHFAESLIEQLIDLQKQLDIEPAELIVPLSEVKQTWNIDEVTTLVKTVRGYLYKHGNISAVWVPLGMNTLYASMQELGDLLDKPSRTEEEDCVITMINNMLMWHTVAFMDDQTLLESATASVKILDGVMNRIQNKVNINETEEDIKRNVEFENIQKLTDDLNHAKTD